MKEDFSSAYFTTVKRNELRYTSIAAASYYLAKPVDQKDFLQRTYSPLIDYLLNFTRQHHYQIKIAIRGIGESVNCESLSSRARKKLK
jgi:hypothetical protein